MAIKRMFSLEVVDTDLFLDMPASAQALYFHLGMRADDDGFVSSPKKICGLTGAGNDDLKLLIAKNFLIPFNDGVCVITHWKMNNYIRSDRYHPTIYDEHLQTLKADNTGIYELRASNGTPMVYQTDTEIRLELELDKKKEIYKEKAAESNSPDDKYESFWSKQPNKYRKAFEEFWSKYPNRFNKHQTARNFIKAAKEYGADSILKATDNYLAVIAEKGVRQEFITRSTNFVGQKLVFLGYLDTESAAVQSKWCSGAELSPDELFGITKG